MLLSLLIKERRENKCPIFSRNRKLETYPTAINLSVTHFLFFFLRSIASFLDIRHVSPIFPCDKIIDNVSKCHEFECHLIFWYQATAKCLYAVSKIAQWCPNFKVLIPRVLEAEAAMCRLPSSKSSLENTNSVLFYVEGSKWNCFLSFFRNPHIPLILLPPLS